jgi:uncharacterized protein involved in outer membrane biogenesis
MTLTRRTRIALILVAALPLALLLAAFLFLQLIDWNRARPWLNDTLSAALERPFAIRGDLTLRWEQGHAAEAGDGWRRWVPWPALVGRDVHMGYPATMQDAIGDSASAAEVSCALNPFALLHHAISIPVLRFGAPAFTLRRDADGHDDWHFGGHKASKWTVDLERIVFTKGSVHYVDAILKADITAQIDDIAADPAYGVSWQLRGTYNGEAVTGSGKAGAVLSLQRQTTPYPLAADIRVGGLTQLAIVGTLTRPTELAALDMRLKVAGPSMARLYGLTGLVLPETPPFSTEGHLTGAIGEVNSHWTYDKFTGRVGSSDIGGTFDYRARAPRGKLTGNVQSRQLVFSDLGPLVGADSSASRTARGATEKQPSNRVLPVETFRTDRWTKIDTDVQYQAGRIVRDKQLPISNLSTHIVMQDGVLSLQPLDFDIAGGKLKSNIRLDGSGRVDPHAIRADLKASLRQLKIKELFPTLPGLQATVGQLNGDAALSATGNSVATLLSASNGEMRALVDQGSVSKLLLEKMGLNVGNIVMAKLFGDKQVKLNCLASDFVVSNGLMKTRRFVVDTEDAIINIDGSINLADESMDLTLKPESRGLRILSLRAPLYVRGTFQQPQVSVDKGVLAAKAGGAMALAVLAPVAALLPLTHAGSDQDSRCAALLAEARTAPVAPPPGQRMPARR